MIATRFFLRFMAVVASSATLVSCGGGGGGDKPNPSEAAQKAEGFYAGSITRIITVNSPPVSLPNDMRLVILDGDEFWAMYGFDSAGTHYPVGFVTGQGVSSSGSFTSTNATDFGSATPPIGTLNATYTVNAVIRGTGADRVGTISFTAMVPSAVTFNYSAPAVLADVQGRWSARNLTWMPTDLDISPTGAITGSSDGCAFSGQLTPRTSGKNIFAASITFGPTPCSTPGQTSSGIALTTALPDGRRQIMIAGVIPSRTFGTLLVGSR